MKTGDKGFDQRVDCGETHGYFSIERFGSTFEPDSKYSTTGRLIDGKLEASEADHKRLFGARRYNG